ncbi:chorismate lyase [Halospina sp. K52047b]|nr:chorismate lyase [Halospina sp. K52047b]
MEGTTMGFRPRPWHWLPRYQRRVVRHRGSLTRLLRGLTRHRFRVRVLREGYRLPKADEARELGLPARQKAWIRDVQLIGDDTPWVQARTVIPLHCLEGPNRRLRHLGNRPLGSALFGRHPWSREAFTCGQAQPLGHATQYPARRSRFRRGQGTLLVTECFLPPLWDDIRDQAVRRHPTHGDSLRPL